MDEGRNILLGMTGGIAAYKGAELCRLLVREKAQVKVVMTRNACRFITPLTMQTLSGFPVYTETFSRDNIHVDHVNLARWGHAMVVAPATANIMGKMVHGIADDLLTTLFLARGRMPVLLAPAMNNEMFENETVQRNMEGLREQGVGIVDPSTGWLACGTAGTGRMAEPPEILKALEVLLGKSRDLEGLKVLVTAGPTREPVDPVRYFSNHSSGKMGYALARAARDRGANVHLISGPTSLTPPPGMEYLRVETAAEMYAAVLKRSASMDIIIKAAAVADYRPVKPRQHKMKKGESTLQVTLERNPDILKALGERKGPGQILVGFAAETRDLLKNAASKLKEKNLDLVAANDVSRRDIGFESDCNALTLLFPDGKKEDIPLGSKEQVAHGLLDCVLKIKNRL